LLALLKKREDETVTDIVKTLANTGMFDLKEGRALLQELKQQQYVTDEGLTFKGIIIAQEAEAEFKL
jgi:polyhydroxyalkanoate synthesis regulator phasin